MSVSDMGRKANTSRSDQPLASRVLAWAFVVATVAVLGAGTFWLVAYIVTEAMHLH